MTNESNDLTLKIKRNLTFEEIQTWSSDIIDAIDSYLEHRADLDLEEDMNELSLTDSAAIWEHVASVLMDAAERCREEAEEVK